MKMKELLSKACYCTQKMVGAVANPVWTFVKFVTNKATKKVSPIVKPIWNFAERRVEALSTTAINVITLSGCVVFGFLRNIPIDFEKSNHYNDFYAANYMGYSQPTDAQYMHIRAAYFDPKMKSGLFYSVIYSATAMGLLMLVRYKRKSAVQALEKELRTGKSIKDALVAQSSLLLPKPVRELWQSPTQKTVLFAYMRTDYPNFFLEKALADLNNRQEILRATEKDNMTLLHYAAQKGKQAAVKYLLEQGVNPSSENFFAEKPRTLALRNNHQQTGELLALYESRVQSGYSGAIIETNNSVSCSKELYEQTAVRRKTKNTNNPTDSGTDTNANANANTDTKGSHLQSQSRTLVSPNTARNGMQSVIYDRV